MILFSNVIFSLRMIFFDSGKKSIILIQNLTLVKRGGYLDYFLLGGEHGSGNELFIRFVFPFQQTSHKIFFIGSQQRDE